MTETTEPTITTAGQGSVASLVLGILALLSSWILIGFVFAIVAIALGRRKDSGAAVSRAGVALGWIAIVVGVVAAVARGMAAVNS